MLRPAVAVALLSCMVIAAGCKRRPAGSAGATAAPAPKGPSPALLTAADPTGGRDTAVAPEFGPASLPRPRFLRRPGREAGSYGGELMLASPSAPKTFNPLRIKDVHTAAMVRGTLYAALVEYDREAYGLEPDLAQEWERSGDGRSWTFRLRAGLQWSDGTPLTARDVVFSFSAAMDEALGAGSRDLLTDSTGGLPQVESTDDRTVVFTLGGVHVLFLEAIAAVPLIPRHRWEEAWRKGQLVQALGPDTPADRIVGAGPFRVRSYAPGKRLVLERNPYSHLVDAKGKRLPYLDSVSWRILPDYDDGLRRFLAGEIDVSDQVRATDFDVLDRGEAEGGYTVFDLGASHGSTFVALNQNPGRGRDGTPHVEPRLSGWFRDRRFRLAVSHAIDRLSLVWSVLRGRGRPLHSIVTEANRVWSHDVDKTEYSPETARRLLAEMGLADRDADGVLEDASGTRVTFELATNVEDSLRVGAASRVADDLRRVGLGVDVKPMPFSSLVTRLTETMDWQAVLIGLGGNVPPDPAMWKSVYLSRGGLHMWHPHQAGPPTPWEREIDGLVGALTGTHDFLVRKKAHDRILDLMAKEQPLVFLYSPDLYVAGRVRVGNLRPSSLRPHGTWNLAEMFLTGKR